MEPRRILVGLAAIFAASSPLSPEDAEPRARVSRSLLEAKPVALDPGNPARRRLGPLRYLAGCSLTSAEPALGGISGIHVEGGWILAITDAGTVLRFAAPAGGQTDLSLSSLSDGPGTGRRKADRDAEALVVHGGMAWVGFEGRHEIWRYRLPDFTPAGSAAPEEMRSWGRNSGAEAIVRLPDGRFLVFAEGRQGQETTPVLLFAGDPVEEQEAPAELRYRPPAGYRVTDAALLPDGRILLLNRRFSWLDGVSVRLGILDALRLGEGSVLEADEVAAWAPPLTVDNMEALSVGREGGRTIVWIASDDNFNPLQRTLLLKFEWVG